MDIGIDSFAAILPDPATGRTPSPADRMADLLDEVETADRVGLDVFGVGDRSEHPIGDVEDPVPVLSDKLAERPFITVAEPLEQGMLELRHGPWRA